MLTKGWTDFDARENIKDRGEWRVETVRGKSCPAWERGRMVMPVTVFLQWFLIVTVSHPLTQTQAHAHDAW